MAYTLLANAPSGTNTGKRDWGNTETVKHGIGLMQQPRRELQGWDLASSRTGILTFVYADKEHGVELSGAEGFLVSSSQDPADAVLNAAENDLLSWMRRAYWDNAGSVLSFDLPLVDHPYVRFRSKLIATLLDEAIEDGVTHPAEQVIDEALRANSSQCRDWLSQALVEYYPTRPSLCASILRCIGRIEYDRVRGWGMHVIDDALQKKDTEVREAAIRGLEAWGGSAAVDMLRRHVDAEAWLNEYVQQVIVDLSEATA